MTLLSLWLSYAFLPPGRLVTPPRLLWDVWNMLDVVYMQGNGSDDFSLAKDGHAKDT